VVIGIIDIEVKAATVAAAGLGALVAVLAGATTAHADPGVPTPPPPPALAAPVVPGPAPAAPVAAPVPAAPAVAADAATPAEGVPHLVSPENLPPGTSITPVGPHQSNGGSYLRELWHAVQTQEVSGKDALLLLTQRPLNANATPPPGLAANPQPMPAATPPPPGDPLQQAAAPVPPAAPAPAPPTP
jgi:resuscitation-promoting factor RpfA